LAVIVGITDVSVSPLRETVFNVALNLYNEDFNAVRLINDIAILVLDRDVAISNTSAIICLPSNVPENLVGKNVVSIGW